MLRNIYKMASLLDLPAELLEEIASQVACKRKCWSTRVGREELSLRLIHPVLAPIFTQSFFKYCTISVNPRNADAVVHLSRFSAQLGIEKYITSLEIAAPNFLQRTHPINNQVYGLIAQFWKLEQLDLNLDGHFLRMDEFPEMRSLKHLILQGESLYSQLHSLPEIAPCLTHLDILAPTLSRAPPAPPGISQLDPQYTSSISLQPRDLPTYLTHLHISNINTPSNQTLLLDLPFRPTHFSFSLMYNYDLAELALLLCRDCFCARTVSIRMVKSKLVAPARLKEFKETLYCGLAKKDIRMMWPNED